jgi:NADPH:quinone reductase-like Zn-dependent oxidoreductase
MKTTQRLRVYQKGLDIDSLALPSEASMPPAPGPGQVLIEIRSAGINPSDVKAALGAMPHAVWPRTPGRDWAGVVLEGPDEWIGREVWGSGGELGIRRDGSHGGWLLLEVAQVRAKPATISLLEAGAVGVPFITAWEGFTRAGLPKPGDVVLVLGGNGKVGQAATQIATMLGARVFAVERTAQAYAGHASGPVTMLDASAGDIADAVRAGTGGHGADIVFNTVGSPYFEAANRAMALRGRQIFISTIDRNVPFDIFAFYRGQHSFVGIDTLALDGVACAKIFDALTPGFESKVLRPFPVLSNSIHSLSDARAAYALVLYGVPDRVVLVP